MMVGPMKKKIVTSVIVTSIVAILVFGGIAFFGINMYSKQIDELKLKSETLQRYVFVKDLTVGTKITEADVELVGVKALSAPEDSYQHLGDMLGKVLCSNVSARTIVSENMFYTEDDSLEHTERLQEFNMISLPSDINENDYIDVRVRFPDGEDYSVLVAKKIEKYSNDTIFLRLDEDEILTIGSAIVEAYMLDGTKLYANKYINPIEQLYNYTEVDYVSKYKELASELINNLKESKLAQLVEKANSERTEEEGALTNSDIETLKKSINVTEKDIDVSSIASKIGLPVSEVELIRTAVLDNDAKVLDEYSNYIRSEKVSIARTYPVKSNVLEAIKNNPNIVNEVKANFSTSTLLAQRLNMINTDLTYDDNYIKNITTRLEEEIQLQKEERRAYIESLTM